MTKLSVNVNKLATLRNARGKNLPDVASMAQKILNSGAHGITVHPRPDQRHIRRNDVFDLAKVVERHNHEYRAQAEFNIEGFPSEDYLNLVETIQPDQATLVPDPPEAITSNAGWDVVANLAELQKSVRRLKTKAFTRVSLFIDPSTWTDAQAQALLESGADRIELYTERFADFFDRAERTQVTADYVRVADWARGHGLGVNAGHDLNQKNLPYLVSQIPWLNEVSIGHALFCEALEQGLQTTLANYLIILEGGK